MAVFFAVCYILSTAPHSIMPAPQPYSILTFIFIIRCVILSIHTGRGDRYPCQVLLHGFPAELRRGRRYGDLEDCGLPVCRRYSLLLKGYNCGLVDST